MALTTKQQQWITNHFKNTKNDVIMQKFNISHSALHRFAREAGLKKTKQFQKKCQLAAAAKAHQVNISNNWPPKGYIIPKSEANRFQCGITPVERIGVKRNKERIAKSVESRKKTLASEKRRVLFGLPQKTKLKVVASTHKKVSFRHLLKKRGYIVERAARVIYYTENTNRSMKSENTASMQYSLRICQLEAIA